MQYLIPSIFEKKVNRNIFHTRSGELRNVLRALRAYWDIPSADGIRQVSKRLHDWREKHPKEFKNRCGPIAKDVWKELEEEYKRWGITGLATDTAPAQNFLVDKNTGHPIRSNQISPLYYYHSTNFQNMRNIIRIGLDPNFGGKGGASARVNRKDFKAHSKGKIHASGATHTAADYALLHDEPHLFVKVHGPGLFRKGVPDNPDRLAKMGLVLRFRKNIVRKSHIEKDPDDPRDAWRIYHKILPSQIEALTTEGWVPIRELTELSAAIGKA